MNGLDLATLVRDYGDIDGEVGACRRACALFDFSFISRARVTGAGALAALARLQPRPMHDLPPGRIRYALRIGSNSAVLADLTIWNLGRDCYEVMSGRHVDVADLASFCAAGTTWEDLGDETAIFAVQGPATLEALVGLTDTARLARLPYFGHGVFTVAGVECRIGRLGYTGERGFELILPRADGPGLWHALAERARPAGFAAADCLRIEAGFILFANECRLGATPGEMGLERFAGATPANRRPRIRLVCFKGETPDRPILWQPAPDATVPTHPSEIAVTSACHSAQEDCAVGLGYVRAEAVGEGRQIQDPGGHFRRMRLTSLPLYDRRKMRPRTAWPADGIDREPAS